MQDCFDTLYAQSVCGHHFYNLTELMSSKDNIRLAYRNIKRNTGSKTAGIDKLTIKDVLHLRVEDVIEKFKLCSNGMNHNQLDGFSSQKE